jgi:hypothetical protein
MDNSPFEMTLTTSVSNPPKAGDPDDERDGLEDPDLLGGALRGAVEAT